MRNKLRSPNKKGFTIIEIMIVLAIAGLILLIVFLAVPALQRNSRNTQRKSDVAAVLAAVNEFASNNNGATATTCSGAASPYTIGGAGTTTAQVKVGYYNKSCVTANPTQGQVEILAAYPAGGIGAAFTDAAHDYAVVVPAASCNGGATAAGSARQVAVVYEIETGSGTFSAVCQES